MKCRMQLGNDRPGKTITFIGFLQIFKINAQRYLRWFFISGMKVQPTHFILTVGGVLKGAFDRQLAQRVFCRVIDS